VPPEKVRRGWEGMRAQEGEKFGVERALLCDDCWEKTRHASFNNPLRDHLQSSIILVVIPIVDTEVESIGTVDLDIDEPGAQYVPFKIDGFLGTLATRVKRRLSIKNDALLRIDPQAALPKPPRSRL